MRKAFSYVRFSTHEQGRGDSLRRQTEAAQAYAAQNHLELDDSLTFMDKGVSGLHGANMETGRLGAFLYAVEEGVVPKGSVLLVENLDRLSRQSTFPALGVLVGICNAGVSVVTLSDRREYTKESIATNPWELLVPVVTFIRANEESITKGRRVRAAWDNKRANAKAKPLTAVCPAWLTFDRPARRFVPNPERVKVVQRIYTMALAGHGAHKIVETLNSDKVPTFACPGENRKRANLWYRAYVVKILRSPAVVGVLIPSTSEYVGEKRVRRPLAGVRGYYPAIVKRSTFDRVQSLRATRAPTGKSGASGIVRNVFGGLARCPKCGSTMALVNKGKDNGQPYLACTKARVGKGCTYRAVRYDALEAALLRHSEEIVERAAAAGPDASIEQAIARTEEELGDVASRVEHTVFALQAGGYSSAMRAALDALEAERDSLQARLAQLALDAANAAGPMVAAKLRDLRAALSEQPLDRPRVNVVLRQLLKEAVIDYPNGAVVLRWRHGGESEVLYAFPGTGSRLRKRSQDKAAAAARAARERSAGA